MQAGLTILNQVFIMLLLILTGYFCHRLGLISARANKQLANLLITIVTAALIIDTYQTDFDPAAARNLLISFALSFGILFLGVVVSLLMKRKGSEYSVPTERFGVIYSNSAYMGIPLLLATVGPTGVFYSSAFMVAFNVMTWAQGATMLTGQRSLRQVLRALVTPVTFSILISLPMFFFRIRLPQPVGDAIGYLASLLTPLSMLVSGVFIAQTNLVQAFTSLRVYAVSALRLLVIPAITLFALWVLPIDGDLKLTMLILSAAPCATGTMLFASRFGGDVQRASGVFAVSTLLSIVTMPLLIIVAEAIW